MATSKQDHHNDGQQDRSQGNSYDKPHGVVADLTTWTSNGMHKIAEDNIAYDQGWRHTDGQIKGK